jgi:hypothetical protein
MSCNIRLCMIFNDIWRIKLYIPPSELKHVLDFFNFIRVLSFKNFDRSKACCTGRREYIKCAVRRFPKQTKSCFSNLEHGWFHESEHVRRGLCLSHYVLHICYITQPAGPAGRTCTRYMIVLSFFISGVVVVRVLACRDMSRGAGTDVHMCMARVWCTLRSVDQAIRDKGSRSIGCVTYVRGMHAMCCRVTSIRPSAWPMHCIIMLQVIQQQNNVAVIRLLH